MSFDVYCQWLRRQGHRVIHSESSSWYDAGPRVLQALPYHHVIRPSAREVRDLTLGRGYLALRYSAPLGAPDGMISYHVVLRAPYTLEMLRPQARNGVRRGLESYRIERISLERLASEGWSLQRDTLDRQGRLGSMTRAQWERSCLASAELPGFEAWAALVDGRLAASLLTIRLGDTYYVPTAQAHRDFLRLHVNNALFFVVCRDLLARDRVKGIFFSLHSLDAPESVNEFKFRMGFTAMPVRQKIEFHPWLAPLARRFDGSALSRWLARHPGHPLLAKAEGMLRFHRQSRLPLEKQQWPECLAECRAALLEQARDWSAGRTPRPPGDALGSVAGRR
jgi:hypothetical protein